MTDKTEHRMAQLRSDMENRGRLEAEKRSEIYKRLERLEQREGRVAKVVRLAEEWWLSQRPVGWTEDKHLGNPTVNTSSDAELSLAQAVADLRGHR